MQYYHNISQLDAKYLHFTRYMTVQNRGPHPLLTVNNNTLSDIPTYNLFSLLSVRSFFFDMHLKSKVKSERNWNKYDSVYRGYNRQNH